MKKFFYEERNAEFLEACERVRKRGRLYRVADIASAAILEPAESFYLTTKQYVNIITRMRCSRTVPPTVLGELYVEVFSRYWAIKKESPRKSTSEIAREIDLQTAPRFYISEKQAVKLYYKLHKRRGRHV